MQFRFKIINQVVIHVMSHPVTPPPKAAAVPQEADQVVRWKCCRGSWLKPGRNEQLIWGHIWSKQREKKDFVLPEKKKCFFFYVFLLAI